MDQTVGRNSMPDLNAANLERFPKYKELLINAGFRTQVIGLQDHLVRFVKPTLYLLWGGALFVLLIGCVNVTNLVLVRTTQTEGPAIWLVSAATNCSSS